MEHCFEELDYQQTPLGELVLRRRRSPSVDELVYEVKLDNEMLMSSSVNASEKALAALALEPRKDRPLDVLVGGLGLGYTAAEALNYQNVRQVVVIELLAPVIGWHRRKLVPLAGKLLADPRCSFLEGDFFEHVASASADRHYDAMLLDIDHAPDCCLHARHSQFYEGDGMRKLADCLRPNGVFALWSAWKPNAAFFEAIGTVFSKIQEQQVSFFNPHMNETLSNWIILAEK
jgi:spermidine synthase